MRDLYQKILLDHYKNPRNSRRPHRVTHSCEGYNPLCGDRIIVYLTVEGGIVADAAFEASACAVCTASASVMTEVVKGEPTDRLQAVFDTFRAIVRGETISAAAAAPGDLAAFSGVSDYPVRVSCALLPWRTMLSALEGGDEAVTTE